MVILILIIFFNATNIQVYASYNISCFARVMFEQVYLYKTPTDSDDISNIYFELPKTYFVELIDVDGNFYKAKYQNLTGYVKKDSVQATSSTPINPYLNNINFRVYSSLSESLWSLPSNDSSSTVLAQLPHLCKDLVYIGKINGTALTEGRTNIWFYCFYPTQKKYGYVYSDFCDEITTISQNNETVNYIDNPTFTSPQENIKTIPKNSNVVGIVVGVISVPALLFVFMLLKGTRLMNKERTKVKEVVDY